jgi:7,8-dihydropterin-6-yl-methyl-4-(beta-D-ribofuranosyl)aminobenzene 5'-phosphate synthase
MSGRGATQVTFRTLTENHVDMLLPDTALATRAGLIHHFDPKATTVIGENGIAIHVDIQVDGRYRYHALFDTGMSSHVLLHNAAALGVDLGALDHVVISHGHPDHYGGLLGLLQTRDAALPVSLHPEAFLPRYLRLATGQVAPYYNQDLSTAALEAAGGRPVLHTGPLEVGPGLIASGAIPRITDFESAPGDIHAPNALIQLRDHQAAVDTVPDDQMLIVEIGTDGIAVLVGCSHAGVINSVRYAMELTGRSHVIAIIGGFHLGFPGIAEDKVDKTIEALRDIAPDVLCPMHCTGMRAITTIGREFPDRFLLNCTGTTLELDGTSTPMAHDS